MTFFIPLKTYRTEAEFGAVIDELENDSLYHIRIIASNGIAVSEPSEAVEVLPHPTPTPHNVPGVPKLLNVTAKSNGATFEFEESSEGTKPFNNFCVATPTLGGTAIIAPCNEVAVMGSFFGDISGLEPYKEYKLSIYSENEFGKSDNSNTLTVIPSDSAPPVTKEVIKGGREFEDAIYAYRLFESGATTGYEALRTEEGVNVECEVLLVGAGGAGKSQTLTFGKGGDGGGGQLVIATLPPAKAAGSIFITVPNGGTSGGDNPANTTLKEGETVFTAIAGKNATDKNDAQGYNSQEVPVSWQKIPEFSWLAPGSHYVGGVAESTNQNYPDATFDGQGGAGTKSNKGGSGGNSFVAIRWKK